MYLKAEDGLQRRAPDGRDAKAGPREHVEILGLDPIVYRDPELSAEQRVDESPEW